MPNPKDIKIGKRIRMRRLILKLSQTEVATALGISFQQVQKYETGANRISGSRMVELGAVLKVHPSYFFAEFDGPDAQPERLGHYRFGVDDNRCPPLYRLAV